MAERDRFAEGFKPQTQVPEGTYYFFFPIDKLLNGRGYWEVINDCLDAGVAVAPGEDFGRDYTDWIRVCFTGEAPDRLDVAIERLNRIFPPEGGIVFKENNTDGLPQLR